MENASRCRYCQPVAVYYTNTIDVKGAITTNGSTAYTPVLLTPTLYGDFDGDFDFDAVDAARLRAAWCTCVGDANYDPLTDSDCDGDMDEADWRNFIINGGLSRGFERIDDRPDQRDV